MTLPAARRLSIASLMLALMCLIATATSAQASPIGFVTLTQNATNVDIDVVLNSGINFAETADSGGALFLFNDSVAGSAITNITATLNGASIAVPGGLAGFTNSSISASGFGTFTAYVECADPTSCILGSGLTMNDLHFTVTNVTISQLAVANSDGNLFHIGTDLASVPEPATLSLLGLGLAGVGARRWRQRKR